MSKRQAWPKLQALGFDRYADYLKSDIWADFKRRYREAGQHRCCLVCGTERRVQLHHTTYERLGCEEFADVVPLCRTHHEDVHRRLKAIRWQVKETHIVIAELRDGDGRAAEREANLRSRAARREKRLANYMLPPGSDPKDSVVITESLIRAGGTKDGVGWNCKQLRLLGVPNPARPRNWKVIVLGTKIARHTAEKFLALKGKALPPRPKSPSKKTKNKRKRKKRKKAKANRMTTASQEVSRRAVAEMDAHLDAIARQPIT